MALVRDVIFKARPTVSKLISEEIKKFNLKIVSKLTIKFDPFRDDVYHIRNFSFVIHGNTARASNPRFPIKTEILTDGSEQTLTFELTDGQKVLLKCANLRTLEICKIINQYITPLSPVETEEAKLFKFEKKKKK